MAASVVVEMTGREARLWQAQQRIIEQQLKIEQKYRQVGTEATLAGNKAQTAGQKSSQAFGAGAVSQLQSYASMFAGVAGAIGLVTKAFAEMAQAREQAAQASEASYLGLGSLAQLAKTPEEMREYLAASREAYSKGAGRNQFEAGELVFSLISAGAYEARDLFTELRASGTVADPATLITAAKTMRASMGEQETGDWRAIVSKGFGASAHSPARVEALLQAASRSGTSASAMGMSDEEVMAATALLATAKGTAETGGTYLAQMFRTLKQKGRFKGKTLEDTILEVKAEQMTPEEKAEFFELSPVLARESKRWFKENKGQGLSPQEQELAWAKEMKLEGTTEEERKQWFGRAQGQEAFDIVAANLGEYKKILADVEAAQREDRVKDHLRAAAADPSLRAQRIRNQSKASEELSREELGIMKNLCYTVMDQYAVAVREGREKTWLPPEWAIAITKVINNTNRNLEGDQSWLQRNQDEFRGIVDEATQREIKAQVGDESPKIGWSGQAVKLIRGDYQVTPQAAATQAVQWGVDAWQNNGILPGRKENPQFQQQVAALFDQPEVAPPPEAGMLARPLQRPRRTRAEEAPLEGITPSDLFPPAAPTASPQEPASEVVQLRIAAAGLSEAAERLTEAAGQQYEAAGKSSEASDRMDAGRTTLGRPDDDR